jgi:hypothetical protein
MGYLPEQMVQRGGISIIKKEKTGAKMDGLFYNKDPGQPEVW